ncbi:MAG: fibronectin type III domain-containing protein [Clostridiales bacterium]|nr:fibronectin type III domain-containing protein [Clostridiales bacterium]
MTVIKGFLKVFCLAVTASSFLLMGGMQAMAAPLTWGNNSENILNGGVLSEIDSSGLFFFSNQEDENSLYSLCNEKETKIIKDACSDINVLGDFVYYVTEEGKQVVSYDKVTRNRQVCFQVQQGIDELYVNSEGEFYYLSDGVVYSRRIDQAAKEEVKTGSEILHFIPGDDGIIYAEGESRDYTLYAGDTEIADHVTSFYVTEGYLIFQQDGEDYQVRVFDLFHEFQPSDIKEYQLGESVNRAAAAASHEEEGVCEVCEENAEEYSLTGVIPGEPVNSEDSDSMMLDASKTSQTGAVSILGSVSEGQQNMVRRAQQQHLIEWTPLKNITGWGGGYVFKKGVTYTGLPYGQPVNACYVPWDASLVGFLQAVDNINSKMYTSYSSYNRKAPYYSCDCSSFVSWCWDLPSRSTTRDIPGYSKKVASQSVYSVEIGDAFDYPGSHVVMVSDVGYRGDQIVYVEIIEQTPPSTRLTRYGEGGSKSLADLQSKYIGGGYTLYRSKTRTSVSYEPSPAVVLDGEDGTISLSVDSATLEIGKTKKIKYETTLEGTPSWTSSDTSVATVNSEGKVTAVGGGKATITLKIGYIKAKAAIFVKTEAVEIEKLTATRTCGIDLTWKEVKGADQYQVFRRQGDSDWESLGYTTNLSYSDTGLEYYTNYYYTVCGIINNGTKKIQGLYDTTGSVIKTVTETPVLSSVKTVTYKSQQLNWKAVEGAAGYRVYCINPGSKNWVRLGETKKTSYVNRNLTTGGLYTYTVRAYFLNNQKEVVLSNYDPKGVQKVCCPPTPELKKAVVQDYNRVKVSWKSVKGAEYYRVYRKTADSQWVRLATVKGSLSSYIDKTADPGETYTYTVRALRMAGGNPYLSGYDSKGVTCTVTLDAPQLVSAVSKKAGQVKLTWEAVSGADGYRVYYKEPGGQWVSLDTLEGNILTYTHKNLKSGKTYIYTVRAYWNTGGKLYLGSYDKAGMEVSVK